MILRNQSEEVASTSSSSSSSSSSASSYATAISSSPQEITIPTTITNTNTISESSNLKIKLASYIFLIGVGISLPIIVLLNSREYMNDRTCQSNTDSELHINFHECLIWTWRMTVCLFILICLHFTVTLKEEKIEFILYSYLFLMVFQSLLVLIPSPLSSVFFIIFVMMTILAAGAFFTLLALEIMIDLIVRKLNTSIVSFLAGISASEMLVQILNLLLPSQTYHRDQANPSENCEPYSEINISTFFLFMSCSFLLLISVEAYRRLQVYLLLLQESSNHYFNLHLQKSLEKRESEEDSTKNTLAYHDHKNFEKNSLLDPLLPPSSSATTSIEVTSHDSSRTEQQPTDNYQHYYILGTSMFFIYFGTFTIVPILDTNDLIMKSCQMIGKCIVAPLSFFCITFLPSQEGDADMQEEGEEDLSYLGEESTIPTISTKNSSFIPLPISSSSSMRLSYFHYQLILFSILRTAGLFITCLFSSSSLFDLGQVICIGISHGCLSTLCWLNFSSSDLQQVRFGSCVIFTGMYFGILLGGLYSISYSGIAQIL